MLVVEIPFYSYSPLRSDDCPSILFVLQLVIIILNARYVRLT